VSVLRAAFVLIIVRAFGQSFFAILLGNVLKARQLPWPPDVACNAGAGLLEGCLIPGVEVVRDAVNASVEGLVNPALELAALVGRAGGFGQRLARGRLVAAELRSYAMIPTPL